MASQLFLLCHAATPAMRQGIFPQPEHELDARGLRATEALRPALQTQLPQAETYAIWRSPARCAEQSALALGLAATAAPALAEVDCGLWAGQRLAHIAQQNPDALSLWLREPSAAPHGGESFHTLRQRITAWLALLQRSDGQSKHLLIVHASTIRALLSLCAHAPSAAWRMDIPELGLYHMQQSAQHWLWQKLPLTPTSSPTFAPTAPEPRA